MATGYSKENNDNCPVCSKKGFNRCCLPCGHVICLDCVQKMVGQKQMDNLQCPICKGLFAVPQFPEGCPELSQYVREKYKHDIVKVKENNILTHKSKVMGMAVLNDDLFVVCQNPPNVIFKYDIANRCVGAGEAVELTVSGLKCPHGMAASQNQSCLYITDWSEMFGGRVWRYKYTRGQETVADGPVAMLDVQPSGVSVSPKDDLVLVTCASTVQIFTTRGWIYVYKPSGSDFININKMELPNPEIPRHSLLSESSRYLVCHGWTTHGVTCYLEDKKQNLHSKSFYGSQRGGGSGINEMNRPLSMNLDEDGLVLVVDYMNHRIQLLTEDLYFLRHLITKSKHGIDFPRHVCQHSKTGKMFVSQEDGKVLIFDARHI